MTNSYYINDKNNDKEDEITSNSYNDSYIVGDNSGNTQVKCQAGYRRDPGNPTQDPRWEWRDPALGGGIPPFPPGMKI